MAKANPNDDGSSCPTFEDSLDELQQIVADLEDGSMGLEESMRRFEKGIAVLRSCYQTLEQAEQKVQILTGLDAAGNPVTAPFDATATIEQTKTATRRRPAKKNEEGPPPVTDENSPNDAEGTLFCNVDRPGFSVKAEFLTQKTRSL